MATFTSHSPAETQRLGEQLGLIARPGWVFGLTGDLGAGKTCLVQGIARGLGIHARVQSPTFTLVHEHRTGRLPLFHVDLYRLPSTAAILAAGLEEYLDPRAGVSVIEWFDRWEGPPPPRLCRVELAVSGERERTIRYDPPGP